MLNIICLCCFVFCLSAEAMLVKGTRWQVQYKTWNDADENKYQEFIQTLGKARKKGLCWTLDQCLRSPAANPMYSNMNPPELSTIYSDCADLPYVLRAYFGWMNDLPFAYTDDLVEAKSLSRNATDIRYSRYGNIATSKKFIKTGDKINDVLSAIVDSVSTATYRTNASMYDTGRLFRDTYPVDVDRRFIVPGTVLYDPNGHVAVVYEVTNNGKVHLIDSHPDNSLTAITYGEHFARTGVKIGGGFSNFRPYTQNFFKVEPKKNDELEGYSLIQFQSGPFIYKGESMNFYEYLRARLSEGVIVYDPITEFKDYMDSLCTQLNDRKDSVDVAIKNGTDQMSHPDRLPPNIYGTEGDWEVYATPARDARFRASVREIRRYLLKVISLYVSNKELIDYEGGDLIKDLREIYDNKTSACSIAVTPATTLSLKYVLDNIFALSFDPYHCVELRWGLLGEARANCGKEDSFKWRWYKAEQGLRNRIDRDYTIKTDYTVDELPDAPASQVEQVDLSLEKILQ